MRELNQRLFIDKRYLQALWIRFPLVQAPVCADCQTQGAKIDPAVLPRCPRLSAHSTEFVCTPRCPRLSAHRAAPVCLHIALPAPFVCTSRYPSRLSAHLAAPVCLHTALPVPFACTQCCPRLSAHLAAPVCLHTVLPPLSAHRAELVCTPTALGGTGGCSRSVRQSMRQ